MITLNDSLLLGKGGERACYAHPNDLNKVIKIVFCKESHNEQNKLEQIYYNDLHKHNKNLSHIVDCHGSVQTNLGEGLVFDRVLDYDGTPSKSFRFYLAQKLIDLNTQKELIDELKNYLFKNSILFVDTSLTNIFAQKISQNNYKLIIIDGLGAKRVGFKFWLLRHCPLYRKYKIYKQWRKFMSMYERDIKRVALGKRPITRV